MNEFYIFERSGRLLFHRDFTKAEDVSDERGKLVYGVLFSLKQMIPFLTPPDQLVEEGIRSFSTRAFTLHSYESPTGYRFALVTSPASQTQQTDVRNSLERVFSELFVELVMLDPTYKPATKIESPVFAKALQNLLQGVGTIERPM